MASKRRRAELRDELLDLLAENGERLRELRDENARAVEQLRELGASWTEIGQALGATRQAAKRRYGSNANVDEELLESDPPRGRVD